MQYFAYILFITEVHTNEKVMLIMYVFGAVCVEGGCEKTEWIEPGKLYLYGDMYPFSPILMGTPLALGTKPKSPHAKIIRITCLIHPVKLTSYEEVFGILALWGYFVPIDTVQNG